MFNKGRRIVGPRPLMVGGPPVTVAVLVAEHDLRVVAFRADKLVRYHGDLASLDKPAAPYFPLEHFCASEGWERELAYPLNVGLGIYSDDD